MVIARARVEPSSCRGCRAARVVIARARVERLNGSTGRRRRPSVRRVAAPRRGSRGRVRSATAMRAPYPHDEVDQLPGSRTVVAGSPLMTLEPTGSTGCAGRRGPSGAARDPGRTPSLPWRRCKSFIMSNLPATPPPEQVSRQLGRSSVGKTDRVPAPLPVAAGAATESSAPLVVPGTAPAFRRHADRRPKRAGRGGAGRFGTNRAGPERTPDDTGCRAQDYVRTGGDD